MIVLVLAVTMGLGGPWHASGVNALRPLTGDEAAKQCKTVIKKVHGHKKRVKVCKVARPRATPTPRSTAPTPLFSGPEDVILDDIGNVYVADSGNQTVDKLSPGGHLLGRCSDSGSGGFSAPYGVALDARGDLYVADDGANQIVELSSSGKPLARWGAQGSGGPDPDRASSVAVEAQGDVYVPADNQQHVSRYTPTGQLIATIGAVGTGPGQFTFPFSVAVDGKGNLYVSDSGDGQIQELSPSGAVLARWS